MRSPESPSTLADAGLAGAHTAPGTKPSEGTNDVIKEQSAPWMAPSWGTDYAYTNPSNHYPSRPDVRSRCPAGC
ncbi:hypothetical protein ABZ826_26425 [Streptomyces sp. NPDC047515]|uniref:hypothetical protein n=1 Tax=Streptomyces sp. NPDC047515 TaxID=3155380 RepID=UPI0033E86EA2